MPFFNHELSIDMSTNEEKNVNQTVEPDNPLKGGEEGVTQPVESAEGRTEAIDETAAELETLRQKISDLQAEVEKYKDLYLRKAADFENFKRRTTNEFAEITRLVTQQLILQFLPVIDDLERTLKAARESNDFASLLKGLDLVFAKFMKFLESQGVKPFESVGKEFNVDFHDALMTIPRNDLPPHTVIEELERGYMIGEKVLRHAKVVVSDEPRDDHVSSASGGNEGSESAGGG